MSRILDVTQTGKRGVVVSLVTRYGQVQRQYVKPKDPKTPAQMRVRSNLGIIAARWRGLTEEQRGAWCASAQEAYTRGRLGRRGPLTGCQLFIKINCSRAARGLELLDDPPEPAQFDTNPVGELSITNNRGAISLTLSVPTEPVADVFVLAAAPCSQGKTSTQHFYLLGPLPEREQGVSEITALFVARYGVPKVGTRIFVRTQQHLNGWDDLPKQTTAIVPKG